MKWAFLVLLLSILLMLSPAKRSGIQHQTRNVTIVNLTRQRANQGDNVDESVATMTVKGEDSRSDSKTLKTDNTSMVNQDEEGFGYYTPFSSPTDSHSAQAATPAPPVQDATYNGVTSIWRAAAEGDNTALETFLASGVDVDIRGSEHDTPLIHAAERGQASTVQLLLNKGADINAANVFGTTPLMAATAGGHQGTVKLLLEHGANINMKAALHAKPEETAIEIAIREGHTNIIELLTRYGATRPQD